MPRLRDAVVADAGDLGSLHVASWREAYAGLLPERLLQGLSAEARGAMWATVLRQSSSSVIVAEAAGGIVGFGACGGQRDDDLVRRGYTGEFQALYLLRVHQRGGVGRAMMAAMAGKLLAAGRTAAALLVLRENGGARAFYERLGGAPIGTRSDEHEGTPVTEIVYGWRDLTSLTA